MLRQPAQLTRRIPVVIAVEVPLNRSDPHIRQRAPERFRISQAAKRHRLRSAESPAHPAASPFSIGPPAILQPGKINRSIGIVAAQNRNDRRHDSPTACDRVIRNASARPSPSSGSRSRPAAADGPPPKGISASISTRSKSRRQLQILSIHRRETAPPHPPHAATARTSLAPIRADS